MSNNGYSFKINPESKIAITAGLFGVIWVYSGFRLGIWDNVSPGAGFFPLFIGILTLLFSVIILIQNFKKAVANSEKFMSKEQLKWFFIVPSLALLTVFSMNYIGTFIALSIFFIFWFKWIEKFSWKKSLSITLAILITIYLVFVMWLQVPFPKFFGLF